MSLFSIGTHTNVCGIDVGLHSIRGAQLVRPRQHAPLASLSEALLPKKALDKNKIIDMDGFEQCLRELLKQGEPRPMSARAVVAALPETFIFTQVIQLPNLAPPELKKAMQHEVGQYLPIAAEETYFDYVPLALRPDKQQIDIALFAAPKQLVDDLITVMHTCGLELYALETKSTAVLRALIPAGMNEAALIIEIGSETTRMTVSDHGNVWLTTSVNVGELKLIKAVSEKIGKPETEVRAYLQQHQDEPTQQMLAEASAVIVQEAIAASRYHETRDFQPGKIHRAILAGQGATIPGIVPAVTSALHLKCEPGLPLVSGNSAIDLKFTVALGLAMRNL